MFPEVGATEVQLIHLLPLPFLPLPPSSLFPPPPSSPPPPFTLFLLFVPPPPPFRLLNQNDRVLTVSPFFYVHIHLGTWRLGTTRSQWTLWTNALPRWWHLHRHRQRRPTVTNVSLLSKSPVCDRTVLTKRDVGEWTSRDKENGGTFPWRDSRPSLDTMCTVEYHIFHVRKTYTKGTRGSN